MATDTVPMLPGRLGFPGMTMGEDPRSDPRMIAALGPLGLAGHPEPAPVDASSDLDALLDYCDQAEPGFSGLFEAVLAGVAPVQGVTSSVEIIKGLAGNDITLYIHRPTDATDPLPGILHLHGGGMVILEAAGLNYVRWRDELAATGLVVVGVEFRNGAGKLGPHPFPAGLDDCMSALRWVGDNRDRLGIGKLVVSGESGGGNLTLATTLRAKREGVLDLIAGVYAQCPYISGLYASKPAELTSLHENDGYFLDVSMMGALAQRVRPIRRSRAPIPWPGRTTPEPRSSRGCRRT